MLLLLEGRDPIFDYLQMGRQPSGVEQIVSCNCLDLFHTPTTSGEQPNQEPEKADLILLRGLVGCARVHPQWATGQTKHERPFANHLENLLGRDAGKFTTQYDLYW